MPTTQYPRLTTQYVLLPSTHVLLPSTSYYPVPHPTAAHSLPTLTGHHFPADSLATTTHHVNYTHHVSGQEPECHPPYSLCSLRVRPRARVSSCPASRVRVRPRRPSGSYSTSPSPRHVAPTLPPTVHPLSKLFLPRYTPLVNSSSHGTPP